MNGVLAGLEDAARRRRSRDCRAFVGTSAGSIVAARLAAGQRPRGGPGSGPAPRRPRPLGPAGAAARGGPAGLRGDGATGPARAGGRPPRPALPCARSHWARARRPYALTDLRRRVADWSARFDGRLRVCTVDRRSGRRVVFGAPGRPRPAWPTPCRRRARSRACSRRCAIDGREYVDGGAWA